MFRVSTLTALTAAVFATSAISDTRIAYVDEKSGKEQTVIAVKDGNVRIDEADGSGYTLFRGKDRTLVVVDHSDRSYVEMDEATMEEMSGHVSQAMAEMQRQLEQMPPEQREMMERMMGGLKDTGKSMFEVNVDRTGKRMKRGDYDCEQVFFSVGKIARSELCVVDPGKIDMPADDRRALDAMQDHMRVMAEKMSQDVGINFTFDFDSMGGIPVYMKEDSEDSGELLKNVAKRGLDASLFEVPAGYRKESMGMD